MEKAARKAGQRLRRDFGEVEHLQVSRKGPADFVSKADGYWNTELEDAPVKWTNLKRYLFRVPHYKTYPEEFADYERRTGKPAPNRR